jgi:hypothetical protein
MTTSRSGSDSWSKKVSFVRYRTPASPGIGGATGDAPVSMTMCGAVTTRPPPASVCCDANAASARITSTPAAARRRSTPRRHSSRIRRVRANASDPLARTSAKTPTSLARRARPALCAAARNALDGVHPVLMQVPPSEPRSNSTTRLPDLAKSSASGTPPCPLPTTMRSTLSEFMHRIEACAGRRSC